MSEEAVKRLVTPAAAAPRCLASQMAGGRRRDDGMRGISVGWRTRRDALNNREPNFLHFLGYHGDKMSPCPTDAQKTSNSDQHHPCET